MKQVSSPAITTALTAEDVKEIRQLLPYGWRLHIQQKHAWLTLRQIQEAFYLRTRNPKVNKAVWGVIGRSLTKLGRPDLAAKTRERISFCTEWYNVIQK